MGFHKVALLGLSWRGVGNIREGLYANIQGLTPTQVHLNSSKLLFTATQRGLESVLRLRG